MSKIKENETESAINAYHGFGREVGLELGTINAMRPSHLAPYALIVGTLICLSVQEHRNIKTTRHVLIKE